MKLLHGVVRYHKTTLRDRPSFPCVPTYRCQSTAPMIYGTYGEGPAKKNGILNHDTRGQYKW